MHFIDAYILCWRYTNPKDQKKSDCILKHFSGYDFIETFLMLDERDKWGRLRPSEETEVLQLRNLDIIQKQDMGKLGSRLGALAESEYEQMILSDVEELHRPGVDLKGKGDKIWTLWSSRFV